MLRRDFIISGSMTLAALLILRDLSPGSDYMETQPINNEIRIIKNRAERLHGHARSGCASPPELAALMENGIFDMPLY